MGVVKAVCISDIRGVPKHNVGEARFIENFGLEKDAHGGNWHRQVSLLSYGFDFKNLPVGTRFICGDVVLEMTQIGKQCHKGCEIQKITGDCIMPREGVFARVLKGGVIRVGDKMEILE